MDEKFRQLIELGAGEFEHVDSSLLAHLEGTRCLLKAWNASTQLQDAGLYHGAYNHSHLVPKSFTLASRNEVADIIGSAAENIVYHYCACDTEAFYGQFGSADSPLFYDRFTTEKSLISTELLQQLCELTAANEIETALSNADFVTQNGCEWANLFSRMQNYLSLGAQRKIQHVFGFP